MTEKSPKNPPTQERLRRICWELGSRYPIPNKAGDRITLASVSARLAHLNWSVAEQTVVELKELVGAAFVGARLVLRIYDVTDVSFQGIDARASMDVEVHSLVGNYYLQVPGMECELVAEIGFLHDSALHALPRSNTRYSDNDDDYYALARSNTHYFDRDDYYTLARSNTHYFDRDDTAANQDFEAAYAAAKALRSSFEVDSVHEAPVLEFKLSLPRSKCRGMCGG